MVEIVNTSQDVDEQMDELRSPPAAEDKGVVVEFVEGEDELTAGKVPPEGQERAIPQEGEDNVIPVEGVTSQEAPVETPVAPPVEPVDQPDTVEQQPTVEQPQAVEAPPPVPVEPVVPEGRTSVTPAMAATKRIVASTTADTIRVLTGENGQFDPLRVPDPFDPKNGQTLYNMFFHHDDPEVKGRIDSALNNAVGFVVESDVDDPNYIPESLVIAFSGDTQSMTDVNDRVRYMVALGGTRLVYPRTEVGPDGQLRVQTDAEGKRIFEANTTIPILSELEKFRREDENDIRFAGATILDIPRADFEPEGQAQLDNYLKSIGMSEYERIKINRAEMSGYLPALTSQGRLDDLAALAQNIVAGIVNQPIEGVFTMLSSFANSPDMPDYTVKPAQEITAPTIPYAPTFSQNLAETLGIPEDDADALVGHSGDMAIRMQRIGVETFPILLSLLSGRAWRDKKQQDRYIQWVQKEVGAKNENEILPQIVSQGKTIDGLVGQYLRTEVRAPFSILNGIHQRGTLRALQRAASPLRRINYLKPNRDVLVKIKQKEIEQLSNVIEATEKRLQALPPGKKNLTEAISLTKRIDDLKEKQQKLLNRGIRDMLPETIAQTATEEAIALIGAAYAGQAYQEQLTDSSTYLDDNGAFAEAAGAIVFNVAAPLLYRGGVAGSTATINKISEVIGYATTGITPDLDRKITTGDSAIDGAVDQMYRGLKAADPEFQRYILDQFDYLRGIRDDLIEAKDRDGNPLLSPQSVQLTFSQMTGMMLFDAYSNYIIRTLADKELAAVSDELVQIEKGLYDALKNNDELAKTVQKLTGAGIQSPKIGPIAKTLQSFVASQQKSLNEKLNLTQESIIRQGSIADQYLKGQSVMMVDPDTGEISVPNFDEIYAARDEAIINIGLRNGEPIELIQERLKEAALETHRMYKEGLALGQDIITSNGGDASAKLATSTMYLSSVRRKAVGEAFDGLRAKYPDVYADGRFLVDIIRGQNPELLAQLSQEMSAGAKQLSGLTLPGGFKRGASRQLNASFERFKTNLTTTYGIESKDVQVLIKNAGEGKNGLETFMNLDGYLRRMALDPEGDEVAKSLGLDSKKELVALADNMELPINFSEAHSIASSLGKLATKYEGQPQSVVLANARETFLDNLTGPTYGFRNSADEIVPEVMRDYGQVRQYAKREYYDRFYKRGSWTSKFFNGTNGSAEQLNTVDFYVGNEPSKLLSKVFNTVDGFNSRFLDPEIDGQQIRELESKLAMVFGKYDARTGEYYLDLDSNSIKDLGRILQTASAEEIMRSDYGKELLERANRAGKDYDVVREVLRLANPSGEYNPHIIHNIGLISGRRVSYETGELSPLEPILSQTDINRAVDINRLRSFDEKTQALTNGAINEVQVRINRLKNEASQEAKALQRDIDSFERLSELVVGRDVGNSGQTIYNMIKFNPERMDVVRDTFMFQAVSKGDAETFEEAAELFNGAMRYQLGQYITDQFIGETGRSIFGNPVQRIQDPEALGKFLGVSDPALAEQMKQILGDEHYQSLSNVARFYSGRADKDVPIKFRIPTDLTPEALYSRLNNVNRGVSGVRWTVTEFLLRSLRRHKSNVLQAMFRDPVVAEAFEAIILQNKEITPTLWEKLEDRLMSAVALSILTRAVAQETDRNIAGEVTPDVEYRTQLEEMGLIERPDFFTDDLIERVRPIQGP